MKVCSLYGAGFYYVPGTDTCIKLGSFAAEQGTGVVCNGHYFNSGSSCTRRTANAVDVKQCTGPNVVHGFVPLASTCQQSVFSNVPGGVYNTES